MNDDEHTFAHLAQQARIFHGNRREMAGSDDPGDGLQTRVRRVVPLPGSKKSTRRAAGEKATDRYAFSYLDNNGRYDFSYYGPDDALRYAFDYIDRQAAAGKPFLLLPPRRWSIRPTSPPPTPSAGPTAPKPGSYTIPATSPDMVAYLDKQVGKFVDKKAPGRRPLGQHHSDLRRRQRNHGAGRLENERRP